MFFRRILFLLFPLSVFILTACDDSGDARAQDNQPKNVIEKKLITSLQGVAEERTSLRPIKLELQQDGEKVSGTITADETEHGFLHLPANKSVSVEGTFNPKTATARLITNGDIKTGEIIIEIAQTEEGSVAAFFRTGRNGFKGSRISKGIFPPAEQAEMLSHIAKTALELNNQPRPKASEGACTKEMQAWIDAAYEIRHNSKFPHQILDVFDIPEFEQAMGEKHEKIDAATLREAHGILRGPCLQGDRKKSNHAQQLSHMIINAKVYKDKHYRKIEKKVLEKWAEDIKSLISSDTPLTDLELDWIKEEWRSFGLASYRLDFRDLSPQIQERKEKNKEQKLRLARIEMMDKRKDRFDLLYGLAIAQIEKYPGTKTDVQEKLDKYLLQASNQYIENAKRAEHMNYMLSWSKNVDNGIACLLTSASECKTIAKNFKKAAEKLSYELSKELSRHVENKGLYSKNKTLEDLAQAKKIAERIRFKYKDGLKVGGLSQQWKKITAHRQKLQKTLYNELYAAIENENSSRRIIQFEKTYFLQGDLEQSALRKIDQLLTEKLKKNAPFRNMVAGEYLNALVSKDWPGLQEMDQEYTQGFKPFLALAGRAMGSISPSAQFEFDQMSQNMSVVHAVFATYLLDYQTLYKGCLGPDPTEITINTEITEIRKNGFGFEVSRSSWTTQDHYKIPKRLARHFEKLWRSDFRQGDPALSDMLFNDARISNLIVGIRSVMKKYDCEDPAIKALEAGMIQYYTRVSR